MEAELRIFWLVLGYTCDNHCSHCYAHPTGKEKDWMDIFYAKSIMATMKANGVKECLLIGGEPTLYPDILELIRFGTALGINIGLISNGRRLKDLDFTKVLFGSGLKSATISLVGSCKETHNEITLEGESFEETCNGIINCAKTRQVNTITTICKGNYLEINKVLQLAHRLGARKTILNCAIPAIDGDNIYSGSHLDANTVAKVAEKALWDAKQYELESHLNVTFPLCLLRKKTIDTFMGMGWLTIGCHMYSGKGVVFDPHGNVLPCTHFATHSLLESCEDDTHHFILRNNFMEFWNAPDGEANLFRSDLWRYPAQKCEGCQYWGMCIGGCPLFWLYYDMSDIIAKGGEWI